MIRNGQDFPFKTEIPCPQCKYDDVWASDLDENYVTTYICINCGWTEQIYGEEK